MARNKAPKPLTEAPPDPDSSEEDSSSTEIEDSQDLHHQQQLPSNNDDASSSSSSSSDDDKPLHKTPTKKPNNSSSDEDEDEDDDEDDDDTNTPLVTKQKSISLTAAATPPPKSATTTKPRSRPNVVGLTAEKPDKRALEVDDSKEKVVTSSKKPRKEKEKTPAATTTTKEEGGGTNSKKQASVPFQRLFSDNDELVMLKGMIDYKVKKGVDPMIDVEDFYGFIKGSMGCDVTRTQFADKIRRLKKKYLNASKKKKQPSGPHDLKLFELGKKIWGSEGAENEVDEKSVKGGGSNGVMTVAAGENSGKSKGKVVKSKSVAAVAGEEKEKGEEQDGDEKEWKITECELMEVEVGEEAARERVRKKGLKLMGAKARGELAEMWDKVAVAQREVDELRFEVLKEENRRIVEALKSSKA